MTVALTILATAATLLAAGLVVALVRQQARHNEYTAGLIGAFREERAHLLNAITHPGRPIPDGRPPPKPRPRRSPQSARELARVGTVARPRQPGAPVPDTGHQAIQSPTSRDLQAGE